MQNTEPVSPRQLLREAIRNVENRLPTGWAVVEANKGAVSKGPDAVWLFSAPDGRSASAMVEAKTGALAGRQARSLAQDLRARAVESKSVPILIARYLSPQVREELRPTGVSFIDATGNLLISAVDPGLFLSDRGADRDPWRSKGRPRGTLKGDPAARVVRALLDFSRRWRVRELVAASGASTGATYRVLEYLNDAGLADRGDDGLWGAPDWQRLLRAWAADYSFLAENEGRQFVAPRGLASFRGVLANSDRPYAITAAAASEEWAAVAPTRSMFVYVEDAARDAEEWSLRPTDAGVNVVLLEPRGSDPVAFARTGNLTDGVNRVAPAQIAADLLNGPGRDPQEGDELIRWMANNEAVWRLS
ncbi:hypothetical protein [Microbacterium sp.]|uniref:hypothetical protein n=1 Tax=Microbacterium sp. TaxID=51671 RepID=UPI003F9D2752